MKHHLVLVAALLVGALVATPAADAHTEINVTVCDPFDGFCSCVNLLTLDTGFHRHTYCMFLA